MGLLVFLQGGGQAVTQSDPAGLPYARGFLVTGDYEVGGVDLREELHPVVGGFSTADIVIGGVPPEADIIAAYLFWETTTHGGDAWKTEAAGVQFRGFDIDITSELTVRATATAAEGASCFGSGSLEMHMFMSDVLRFLPLRKDSDNKTTIKHVVNGAHQVKLPAQSGNGIPETSGASLVIVFSDPAPTTPLKKVVIYSGNNRKPSINDDLVQTIQGFYGSAKLLAERSAKITHLVASGQPNNNLKFSFKAGKAGSLQQPLTETAIGASPFTEGPASQRWWANPTALVSSLMKPDPDIGEYDNYGVFGETVSTRIYHEPANGGYDCVALGATVFSTAVQDEEQGGKGDGVPDVLEDTSSVQRDPPPPANYPESTNLLPAFRAMGARSDVPDVFIEVNALWAPGADATTEFPGTQYGSVTAPYASKAITSCAAANETTPATVCTTAGKHNLPAGESTAIITGNASLNGTRTVVKDSDTTFSIPGQTAGSDEGESGTVYISTVTDAVGHHHMPTPYVLGKIGDAFAERGIRVHFDVGKIECDPGQQSSLPLRAAPRGYRCSGSIGHTDWIDDYTSDEADDYLIPSALARGGEFIEERACDHPGCFFPAFPGTVGWALGVQYIRDMPVGNGGEELTPLAASGWPATSGRLRFDPARRDFFRYLLYAHARAKPRSLPCLVDGSPASYDSADGTACTTPNNNPSDAIPDFDALKYHAPSSTSGVANLPGRNAMITVGLWDEFVGRPIQRLGTTMHEIGHLLGLWHGGQPARWGNAASPTIIEPNCKPNYLSSMSYNFQVHGLFDDNDEIHVDFSSVNQAPLNDQSLSDFSLIQPSSLFRAYRPAWFAPVGSSLVEAQGASEAKRNCIGGIVPASVRMARVQADLSTHMIDWDGGGNGVAFVADANFDGLANTDAHTGYDDWSSIQLNRIGSTPSGLLPTSAEDAIAETWGGAFAEVAEGGNFAEIVEGGGFAEIVEGGGFAEVIEGGGFAEIVEGGNFAEMVEGGGFAEIVEGGGFAEVIEGQALELTFEDARANGGKGRPYRARACVIELTGVPSFFEVREGVPDTDPPTPCPTALENTPDYHAVELAFEQLQVGGISGYMAQRKINHANAPDFVTTGQPVPAHLFTFRDVEDLAHDVEYLYRVRGLADDGGDHSGWSRPISVIGVNEPPIAVGDSYVVPVGTTLTVSAADGLLKNDKLLVNGDPDSPSAAREVNSTSGDLPGLNVYPDGSFTFTPDPSFAGPYPVTYTFTYFADNGPLVGDPLGRRMSGPSELPATVTITVTNPAPSCSALTASVLSSSTTLLTPTCVDANGDTLKVTSVGPVPTGGGTATLTQPLSGSFSYTAPPTAGTVTFTYTVSDGRGETTTGTASVTVNLRYGFVNVQNLPAPNKTKFKAGSTIPVKWQWTNAATGLPINTAGQASVTAFSCVTGRQYGPFTAAQPGSGNSFSYTASNDTWTFNWKLIDGAGVNLGAGTYVIQVKNTVTGQLDPNSQNTCNASVITGALVSVVK